MGEKNDSTGESGQENKNKTCFRTAAKDLSVQLPPKLYNFRVVYNIQGKKGKKEEPENTATNLVPSC